MKPYVKELIDNAGTLKEKRAIFKEHVTDKMMNPAENFDPETFDHMADDSEEYQLAKRSRILPPKELPTFGLKPKEIMEGQMIGNFESKQDIYLILAHRCNDLQRQVDELKKLIEGKPKAI